MSAATAGAVVATVYAVCFALNAVVPVPLTRGYVLDSAGAPLQYRLNGLRVALLVYAFFGAVTYFDFVDATVLARHYHVSAAVALALGLAASVACFAVGRHMHTGGHVDERSRCATVDTDYSKEKAGDVAEFRSRSPLAHFYCGYLWNPRLLGADVKMFLYLAGAVMLQLNVLSGLALSAAESGAAGTPSAAFLCYAGAMSFFLTEYLAQEEVHLYTYDLFRERIGFKLVFGCLCFYPFFYAVPMLPLLRRPVTGTDLSAASVAACAAVFLAGWALTRGANLQKHACKTGRARFALLGGLLPLSMETVPGSGGRLLCGGFWGVSRHVNYLGEVLQGVGLALPAALVAAAELLQAPSGGGGGGGLWWRLALPWAYPAYYCALFVPRALDDDALCAAKYGGAWATYRARVPARIVPGLW